MHLLFDNPIIVKHLRSRLRRAKVLPEAIAIVCLCGALTWIALANAGGGPEANGFLAGVTISSTLWCLLAIVLVLLGSEQVGSAVSIARESGILDFHRISPIPPSSVAVGFFLGAPIREYCYAAIILPFLAITAAVARSSVGSFLDLLATLLVVAWLIHASQLLAALVSRRPRTSARSLTLLLVVAAIAARSAGGGWLATLESPTFFGAPLPRWAFLALHGGAATLFLLVGATRQIRDQRSPLLSKWQAVACMTTVATLAIGCLWNAEQRPALAALLPVVVIAGIVLCIPIAVTQGEYLKGIRRARREGLRAEPLMADTAASGWTVVGLCLVVTAAAAILKVRTAGDARAWGSAWAVGMLTIAAYGLALQFFRLRSGTRGDTTCHLVLFLAWVMPLPIAAALSSSGLTDPISSLIWRASPWVGMFEPMIAEQGAAGIPWPSLFTTAALAATFGLLAFREAQLLHRPESAGRLQQAPRL